MADALLHIDDLSKRFGGITASEQVSLAVPAGELHAIIGPNGAGKTTLIGQLTGELYARFRAHPFRRHRHHARCRPISAAQLGLARSFQITSLFLDMTVLDNVALAVQAHDGHSFRFWKPAREEQRLREPARAALARTGLAARADVPVADLSHGEHRQLEIAMALATKPRMLLLDEPMAGHGAG